VWLEEGRQPEVKFLLAVASLVTGLPLRLDAGPFWDCNEEATGLHFTRTGGIVLRFVIVADGSTIFEIFDRVRPAGKVAAF